MYMYVDICVFRYICVCIHLYIIYIYARLDPRVTCRGVCYNVLLGDAVCSSALQCVT